MNKYFIDLSKNTYSQNKRYLPFYLAFLVRLAAHVAIEVLSRTIKDGRVISLIHKYLNAGVIANGMFKTKVAHISKVKYLGYAFYRYKEKCRFRVHPKSVIKMKNKIRELTDRNNGMSNEVREKKYQEYVRGWVEYYKLADMKGLMQETDKWARRRIRAVYWKQWKRVRTRYRILRKLKLEHWQAIKLANSRCGYWRMAEMLNTVLTNKIIAKLGYTSLLDKLHNFYYIKML